MESLPQKGLSKKQLQALDKLNDGDSVKVAPARKKDETLEEKRQRKAMVKEGRKVCKYNQIFDPEAYGIISTALNTLIPQEKSCCPLRNVFIRVFT